MRICSFSNNQWDIEEELGKLDETMKPPGKSMEIGCWDLWYQDDSREHDAAESWVLSLYSGSAFFLVAIPIQGEGWKLLRSVWTIFWEKLTKRGCTPNNSNNCDLGL